MRDFLNFKTIIIATISLTIILFPRVHDTGFLYFSPIILTLPIIAIFGLIYLIKLLRLFITGKLTKTQQTIILLYAATTLIFTALLYYSFVDKTTYRQTIITDYGKDPGEVFEKIVPIYLFEDLAYLICGVSFFLIYYVIIRQTIHDNFGFSLKYFSIFATLILSVHFYFTDKWRPVKYIEKQIMQIIPAPNSTYPKVAGQCKYEHLCFNQTFVRIDSLVFQSATFG